MIPSQGIEASSTLVSRSQYMNIERIKRVFTEGLLRGYAGKATPTSFTRGEAFNSMASHYVNQDGDIYHDEWVAMHQGGGQELVAVGSDFFTRLYAGGSPEESILGQHGTSTDEVSRYLIRQIVNLGDKTRLFEDCLPKADGEWQYSYKIQQQFPFVSLTVGKEMIHFKKNPVHVHIFMLSPVK